MIKCFVVAARRLRDSRVDMRAQFDSRVPTARMPRPHARAGAGYMYSIGIPTINNTTTFTMTIHTKG